MTETNKTEDTFVSKTVAILFGWMHRLNARSEGYVPFCLWLMLLIGGIWFPAGPILKHIFEDGPAPVGVFFTYDEANSTTVTSTNSVGEEITTTKQKMSAWLAVVLLPACLMFWSWSNIALMCLMASAMGEVNRWAETEAAQRRKHTPTYRSACTRAFFVYLFVLLNEIAVVGSLAPESQVQGTYTRIAVLSSLFAFVASYRPSFFQGMVSTVSTMGQQNGQSDQTVENKAAAEQNKGLRPAVDDFDQLNVAKQ